MKNPSIIAILSVLCLSVTTFSYPHYSLDSIVCGRLTPSDTIEIVGTFHNDAFLFCSDSNCIRISFANIDSMSECASIDMSTIKTTLRKLRDQTSYCLTGRILEFSCSPAMSFPCPYQSILYFKVIGFRALEKRRQKVPKHWTEYLDKQRSQHQE
jgi:hypothetical protein